MRIVIQRVLEAKVVVDERVTGSIGKGFLILLGIGTDDTSEIADKYIDKMLKMRIFEDENGKTNKSLQDVAGEILVVSQFTLYADCKKGNRPSFINAAKGDQARELYEYVVSSIQEKYGMVETGEFGAHMAVSLVNDGPFTIVLDENLL